MQTVLQIAPHPDDETLGAGGTLLQLGGCDWLVATLACSVGRPTDAARRRGELREACRRAGFALRETHEPIGISASDDLREAESRLAIEISNAVRDLHPSLLVGPGPHDGHHGHEVVGRSIVRALAGLARPSRPRWWIWELWSTLPAPTLYASVPDETVTQLVGMLQAHKGELARNDYERALRARGELAVVLGAERIFGWGTRGPGDAYAEIFTEILCDQQAGWPLAAPRRLDPDDALAGAVPHGIDLGHWLHQASQRADIFEGTEQQGT